MSHGEWLAGGIALAALGIFAAAKLLLGGRIVMWDYEAPEGAQADDEVFDEPQAHLDAEAWIAEHRLEWWVEMILQEEEAARTLRVPRAARRSA